MPKRVLVVGGLGFIGSEVVTGLYESGYEVVIIDNFFVGSEDRLNSDVRENVKIITADIRDAKLLEEILTQLTPDTVINMAALHYIPYCIEHPEETLAVNVEGTRNIIKAIKKVPHTPRFIMASSAAVYGAPTTSPQPETTQVCPVDIYGQSKKLCEEYITNELTDYILLRLFNTYGPNDPHPHLIPSIISKLDTENVALGNPSSSRDYVYVKDVARAFVKAVQSPLTKKIYNVGSGETRTVKDVCDTIAAMISHPPEFTFNYKPQLRAHDPAILHADISRISKELGWYPSVSFEKGLSEVIRLQGSAVR